VVAIGLGISDLRSNQVTENTELTQIAATTIFGKSGLLSSDGEDECGFIKE
jgi:hypothetical protein